MRHSLGGIARCPIIQSLLRRRFPLGRLPEDGLGRPQVGVDGVVRCGLLCGFASMESEFGVVRQGPAG